MRGGRVRRGSDRSVSTNPSIREEALRPVLAASEERKAEL
jgi:hypothetical protein